MVKVESSKGVRKMEELKAMIPLIPYFIDGCQAIWPLLKPILFKYKYPTTKELEERIIKLEQEKNITSLQNLIEELASNLGEQNINQSSSTVNGNQIGNMGNGNTVYNTTYNIGTTDIPGIKQGTELDKKLSIEAEKLLAKFINDPTETRIMTKKSPMGYLIPYIYHLGCEDLPENKDAKSLALFEKHLKELITAGFVDVNTPRMNNFQVNSAGDDYYDKHLKIS